MGVYNSEPKASHCKAQTDRTRIFYRACEKKQQIECKVFNWTCMSKYHWFHMTDSTGQK